MSSSSLQGYACSGSTEKFVHDNSLHAELQLINGSSSSLLISSINSKAVAVRTFISWKLPESPLYTTNMPLLLKDAFEFCPCASLDA
jgi:hypothetical protein